MNTEQRARELLAAELDAIRFPATAAEIRDPDGYNTLGAAMVRVVARALESTLPAGDAVRECKWEQQDRGSDWVSTGCGHEFVLNDASQHADGEPVFPHCCYCAAPMIFLRWKTDNEALAANREKGV